MNKYLLRHNSDFTTQHSIIDAADFSDAYHKFILEHPYANVELIEKLSIPVVANEDTVNPTVTINCDTCEVTCDRVHNNSKAVIQCHRNGRKIREFSSISEAAEATNTRMAGISMCYNKRQRTANGYRWKFK